MGNDYDSSNQHNDTTTPVRHTVTSDAYSLLDTDAVDISIEDEVFSSVTLANMIRSLKNPSDKFVIVCIMYGFQKNEIGYMLDVHPSKITRMHQLIQQRLRRHYQSSQESDRSSKTTTDTQAIINFFKVIFPNDPAIRRLK